MLSNTILKKSVSPMRYMFFFSLFFVWGSTTIGTVQGNDDMMMMMSSIPKECPCGSSYWMTVTIDWIFRDGIVTECTASRISQIQYDINEAVGVDITFKMKHGGTTEYHFATMFYNMAENNNEEYDDTCYATIVPTKPDNSELDNVQNIIITPDATDSCTMVYQDAYHHLQQYYTEECDLF